MLTYCVALCEEPRIAPAQLNRRALMALRQLRRSKAQHHAQVTMLSHISIGGNVKRTLEICPPMFQARGMSIGEVALAFEIIAGMLITRH